MHKTATGRRTGFFVAAVTLGLLLAGAGRQALAAYSPEYWRSEMLRLVEVEKQPKPPVAPHVAASGLTEPIQNGLPVDTKGERFSHTVDNGRINAGRHLNQVEFVIDLEGT